MSLSKEFKKSVFKPAKIADSRFGIRRIFLNTQESPRVASYQNPGRNWHGTR